MRGIIRFFNNLFPVPPSKCQHEHKKENIVHSLIRRFARGNIRLQDGKYLTKDEAAQLKKIVARHRF